MTSPRKTTPPDPGSDEAIPLGCICAVLDNGHGRAIRFWITIGCPVHSPVPGRSQQEPRHEP